MFLAPARPRVMAELWGASVWLIHTNSPQVSQGSGAPKISGPRMHAILANVPMGYPGPPIVS